jgi:hypothetical protein
MRADLTDLAPTLHLAGIADLLVLYASGEDAAAALVPAA